MKRFALLTVLLAVAGLSLGCDSGGSTTPPAAPEASAPADSGDAAATEEAPAEGEEG
ncbi:MAG: hypothetical protein KDA37_07400 [Planctomycetales bacterium]|nr:hypothetical protein [Planctomycetales bacterium]